LSASSSTAVVWMVTPSASEESLPGSMGGRRFRVWEAVALVRCMWKGL
jgi:hypothetical protein